MAKRRNTMGRQSKKRGGEAIEPWWTLEGKDSAESAFRAARVIERALRARREEMLHHMRLYAGRYDLRGGSYSADQQPSYNITRSIVDTAQSLIAQAKPRPFFMTSDGGWELKQRAKLRARIIDGQFDVAGIDNLRPTWFLDGAVAGTGIMAPYVDRHTHAVRCEIVSPLLFLVDPREGIGCEARTTYRLHCIDRAVLAGMFEDDDEAQKLIEDAGSPESAGFDLRFMLDRTTTVDQVLLLETVHLPSSPNAEDGKRMLAVTSGELETEPYEHTEQPYAIYRYQDDPHSFYGLSLAEQCRAASRRLNRLGETIESASRLLSTAKIMASREAEVDVRSLNNGVGELLEYNKQGGAPAVVSFSGLNPAWFSERHEIREEVFAATGLSTLQAEGKKPPGLNSGAAQIAHDDIQSRRHVMPAQAWESAHMRLVSAFEVLNDRNAEDGHDIPLPAKHRRGRREYVREVKWSEVTKDAGRLYTRTFPVSSMPSTPHGKWALVQDWIKTGFVSRMNAQQMMDFPDLDDALRYELADLDAVQDDIERIIDGEYDLLPEPVVSPTIAVDISRAAYLQLRADEAPDDILDAVLAYLDGARELVKLSQQPPAAQPGAATPVGPEQAAIAAGGAMPPAAPPGPAGVVAA